MSQRNAALHSSADKYESKDRRNRTHIPCTALHRTDFHVMESFHDIVSSPFRYAAPRRTGRGAAGCEARLGTDF